MAALFPTDGLRVLCYHSISDQSNDRVLAPYSVPPDLFEAQLQDLTDHGYQYVSAADAYAYLRGEGELPKKAVLVTFDDGYLDFVGTALPILERLEIPSVMFAVTQRLGETNTWDQKAGAGRLAVMSAQDLKTMDESGVEIGGHGQTHVPLGTVTGEQLRNETQGSLADLKSLIGPTGSFAYPHGSFNDEVLAEFSDEPNMLAFTIRSGIAYPDGNLLTIPRFMVLSTWSPKRLRFLLMRGGRPIPGVAALKKILRKLR